MRDEGDDDSSIPATGDHETGDGRESSRDVDALSRPSTPRGGAKVMYHTITSCAS